MDRQKTMGRLKKRAEFLAAAGGARASRRGFLLQKRDRDGEVGPRFGFTVTKKMGNSPERNRIRRRLREAVRLAAAPHASLRADYVLIGRRAALSQPFEDLVRDLISGLASFDRPPASTPSQRSTTTAPDGGRTRRLAAPNEPALMGPTDRSAERSDR
ncbi:ribonuclease P protein component [Mesorhizobium sp. BR1-1-16]|uniref:ribonuclease P protein component n=1 Tax=Mesorhizobium sp. BR1-1-16 TaxID=2876653 RepID=UPI001CC9237B|nr:ribonuclease P protein component [Mesorhizobium sp. BR1-1-16]MBZ9938617.1 ribonuclease P protein component [Mesorhizobium sp. BR1-1-16]